MNAAVMQRDVVASLLSPDAADPVGLRVPAGASSVARFAVHRNTFVATLVDALADGFPVTQAIVGTEFFRAMARARIHADPPRSPLLMDYARKFPRFIATYAAAGNVPWLAAVARIEALRIESFHAEDALAVDVSGFMELAGEPQRLARTTIGLHPAARWLRSRHAAYSLWAAHQGLQDMATAELGGIDTALGEDVLVARPALELIVARLPPGALEFLEALAAGCSVAAAFAEAQQGDARTDPATIFSALIRHGLAVTLQTSEGEQT
ncbi:MAG: HvfC/BufC family peptide modification chaperone [Arenimonas sp.]